MELPPEHNSFRRLLAYRLAQRFGLTHAVSDQINEVLFLPFLRFKFDIISPAAINLRTSIISYEIYDFPRICF